MSDETRDYPEWLDRELFGHLTEAEDPAPAPAPPPAEESAAPKKKKGAKDAGRSDKAASGRKPKEKAAAPAPDKPPKDAKKPKGEKRSGEDGEKPKKPKGEKGPEDGGKPKKPQKAAEKEAAPKKKEDEAAEAEKARIEKQKKGGKAARGVLITLIVVASLALILCVAAMVGSDIITASDANLPNVYVGEIYVGGMTREQTVQALRDGGWEKANGGTLTVRLPQEQSFELDYLKAGVTVSVEEIAEKAYAYGHSEDRFANLLTYISDMLMAKDLGGYDVKLDESYIDGVVNAGVDAFDKSVEGEEYLVNDKDSTLELVKGAGQVTLDRAALCAKVREALLARESEIEWTELVGDPTMPDFSAIAATLAQEAHDAYYDPTTGEVVPEIRGVEVDAAKAQKLWKEAGLLETVSIPIKIVEPEVRAEDLESTLFRDRLGYCKTTLVGSIPNRKSNIALACSRFDEMVLMPGQRFSYNEVVGERTEEAGFKFAGAYNGNKVTQEIGGGICQVSSTLYNAVLQANLEINERSCHNLVVDYLPMGLDATVSWGGPEFVFTNNRDLPIKLKAGVDAEKRNVIIEVWGTNTDGSHVEMISGLTWPIYDQDFLNKYGIEVQIEWGARTIRRVFDADGNYTDYPEAYSYYHLHEEEIRYPFVPDEDDGGEEEYAGDGGTEVVIDSGGESE